MNDFEWVFHGAEDEYFESGMVSRFMMRLHGYMWTFGTGDIEKAIKSGQHSNDVVAEVIRALAWIEDFDTQGMFRDDRLRICRDFVDHGDLIVRNAAKRSVEWFEE